MKKYLLIILIALFSFSAATPAHAYFWSNWFKKSESVTAVVPPAPKVIDAKDVERRVNILKDIFIGSYQGGADVQLSFTSEEINKVVLPLVEKYLQNFVDEQGGEAQQVKTEVKKIILQDGAIEIGGRVGSKLNTGVVISLGLKAQDNKLWIDIQKVKLGWFVIPKFAWSKLLSNFNIKSENLSFTLPNFFLSDIVINSDSITIKGKYLKPTN